MTKALTPIFAVVLATALAIAIGPHITEPAAAILIGMCIGAGASIPTAILMIALLRREHATRTKDNDDSAL